MNFTTWLVRRVQFIINAIPFKQRKRASMAQSICWYLQSELKQKYFKPQRPKFMAIQKFIRKSKLIGGV